LLHLSLIIASAVSFTLGSWQAARLTQGARPLEQRIWVLVSIGMASGVIARIGIAVRDLVAVAPASPIGLEILLVTIPASIAIVFAFFEPILRTYRVAERRRQESEAAFRRSLDEASDPVAILDARNTIAYANRAAAALAISPWRFLLGCTRRNSCRATRGRWPLPRLVRCILSARSSALTDPA
jgi:PAS domain-containing protein